MSIASTIKWPQPSSRVRELLRQGAEIVLNAPPEWVDEVEQAGREADALKVFSEDPVLLAASRRITRASLIHWAAANLEHPGAPVCSHRTSDMLDNARELMRRGATELIFRIARAGENAAWQRWMSIAFTLTADPTELHELLNVSSRSIGAFLDANMADVMAVMKAEREEQMRGTPVDRRQLVTRIMEGAAINAREASQRLGYTLDQTHHAAVIWSNEASASIQDLELAAQALAQATNTQHTLTVVINAATLWAWCAGDQVIDLSHLNQVIRGLPSVRIALGSGGCGIEGFRRAHIDATTTQRVLGRLHSSKRVVSFDMVRLVSLMTRDEEAARQFVTHTLGDLATAPLPLRRTMLAFLRTGSNATQATQGLHIHRNTLLRRLTRAEELLPQPLELNRIHVAAALEALDWTNETGHR